MGWSHLSFFQSCFLLYNLSPIRIIPEGKCHVTDFKKCSLNLCDNITFNNKDELKL